MGKRRYVNYELNDVNFILDLNGGYEPKFGKWDYTNIWNAYNKPSIAKEQAWEGWKRWFNENGGECWVSSRNTFKFTITGKVVDSRTGELLGVRITDVNRWCWSITK